MQILHLLSGNQRQQSGCRGAVDELVIINHKHSGTAVFLLTYQRHNFGLLGRIFGETKFQQPLRHFGIADGDSGGEPFPAVSHGTAGTQQREPEGFQLRGMKILPYGGCLAEPHGGTEDGKRVVQYLFQLPVYPGTGQNPGSGKLHIYHPLYLSDISAVFCCFLSNSCSENATITRKMRFSGGSFWAFTTEIIEKTITNDSSRRRLFAVG